MATFNLKIFSPFGVHYEGEAEAILKIREATATGIKMINEAAPSNSMISLRSLETLEKIINYKAN